MNSNLPPAVLVGLALPVILLGAFLIGSLAQWLLRGRVRIGVSPLIVISVLGISVGLLLAGSLIPSTAPWSLLSLAFALGLTVLGLILFAVVAAHFQPRIEPVPIAEVIRFGESERVEFKSSARWNLHTKARDDRMEQIVAKTVAGFLNAEGGTLLIGVSDDGRVLGLADDFSTVKLPDPDRYELWLRDFLTTALGPNAATLPVVDFAPVEVDGVDTYLCRLSCPASPRPVFVRAGKGGGPELWVRTGNSTRLLKLDEAIDYVMHRWPLSMGSTVAAQVRAAVRFSGGA